MSDDQELVTKPFNWYEVPRPDAVHDCETIESTDARFPNMNQTKHCWQNYVDYHKCINAKGEHFAPCRQFWLAYRSLCPSGWYTRWDEQREAGSFPVKLDA
ncbi:cytochrome c oxidase polypeptide VIb [Verticillium dahliae VdLs.17]|uniref:Cytochrome c oxidase subunit 12, mitochondrial n=1 Tax=Verticillium dahliae (strain VdLs.17 / ATCC MYA-4575 / FGSC 10137) TaxID=498257 RepID=G2XGD9_VERDV|nr:cytochrome c oxidase polypeptide VIb [Verticillium dahliae VdLs.17]EGY18766.1 cytochrome c oxidase polypeptide VIb [Verticillium dahliae VdLs.17]KAF3350438.1 hypothetical protein VdG2_01437 [Verticillium dahliae VDG2]